MREEKVKAANTLQDVKRVEEELERLNDEKTQVDLHEKVAYLFDLYMLMHNGLNKLSCLLNMKNQSSIFEPQN